MPRVLHSGSYRFFFYSADRHELVRLRQLVEENKDSLLRQWNEYFTD